MNRFKINGLHVLYLTAFASPLFLEGALTDQQVIENDEEYKRVQEADEDKYLEMKRVQKQDAEKALEKKRNEERILERRREDQRAADRQADERRAYERQLDRR